MKVRSRQNLIDDVRNAPDTAFRDTADRGQLLSVSRGLPEGYYVVKDPELPGFLHTILKGPFRIERDAENSALLLTALGES